MRLLTLPLPFIISALVATSEAQQAAVGAAAAEPSPKEAAIEKLLSERSSLQALESAIQEATKQGVTGQAVLEARFVFHVDRNEDAAVAALLPQFLERKDTFKVEESQIFATKDEWLAVIEYIKALSALQAGDKAGFKTHITEAFWLSPKQGNAFAPHIDRLRLGENLAAMKVDFSETFEPVTEGGSFPLSKIVDDKKALLLQFWSPLSAECEALLPDFAKITEELEPKGIAVATLIMDHNESSVADTRGMIGKKPAGAWLIDHANNPLSPRMGIQTLPTFVLISREGDVLSFGSAGQAELWKEITKINPSIKQPELESTREDNNPE